MLASEIHVQQHWTVRKLLPCTATDSSDSRRTPTQRVNEHLLGVQRVAKSQGCDTSLL